MPTNRIALIAAAIATAAVLAGCGGGSTATQSAGIASSTLTTTSSIAPSDSASSTTSSAATSTTASSTASTASTSTASTSQTSSSQSAKSTNTPAHAAKHPIAKIAVASAAFPKGGEIPVRYTCEGGNVSPPLRWGKVPTGTSQLFVLALSLTAGPQGAIRWAVGGIAPSAGGFGSGQLPPGAVVGRSSDGQVGWSGICPVKGRPQAIIVLLYALRHPVALTPGFQPSAVQAQLSSDTIGTGVVYGAYKKP
jgi:phosphatidylethanolamine-binding protein (PEBP) family uncharacterized protein